MQSARSDSDSRELPPDTVGHAAPRVPGRQLVHDRLREHFLLPGVCAGLEELVVSRDKFPQWMLADIQRELDALFAALPGYRFCGARFRGEGLDFRFPNLLEAEPDSIAVGPAVYTDADIGEATPVRCLQRGLWLAEAEGVRFGLLIDVETHYHGTFARLEVAVPPGAPGGAFAARLMRRLRAAGEAAGCYRGKVLTLGYEPDISDESPPMLRVERIAVPSREDIIFPEPLLELIERNTLGFARRVEALATLGMSGRKGVLLYGPPGTGKTLLIRYLAGQLAGFTTFLVSAQQYSLLGEVIAAARLLQPALVVLEDVDLVGADRDGPRQHSPAILNELLNHMDGLAPEARMLFILTTNRPEMLEPALAGRPGRVDQAIEIGLPEDAERRRLIRRYAGTLHVDEDAVVTLSQRIGKVSPAFIKELMRRAAQGMLDRMDGLADADMLQFDDLERAIDDMLVSGGKLNARLLGAQGAMGFGVGD